MCVSIYMMMLLAVAFSLEAAEGEKAFEHETGFYYTVQKGDTLWDLSQKFCFGAQAPKKSPEKKWDSPSRQNLLWMI